MADTRWKVMTKVDAGRKFMTMVDKDCKVMKIMTMVDTGYRMQSNTKGRKVMTITEPGWKVITMVELGWKVLTIVETGCKVMTIL